MLFCALFQDVCWARSSKVELIEVVLAVVTNLLNSTVAQLSKLATGGDPSD